MKELENKIKEKLESRKIEPSNKAWDRLDAMLSVEEKPKRKVAYWKYIAASIMVVFGITYWFINQNPTEIAIPKNTIVTTDENKSFETTEEENLTENKVESNKLIEEIKPKYNSVVVQNKVERETKILIENKEITPENEVFQSKTVEPFTYSSEPITQKYISAEQLLASIENDKNPTDTLFKTKKIR